MNRADPLQEMGDNRKLSEAMGSPVLSEVMGTPLTPETTNGMRTSGPGRRKSVG
jgi:hypothetical protein